MKILAADDEADYRRLIRIALEPLNADIIEATNGREALEKIYRENPDLLLLDINMPLMDGYAVCRKIRQDPVYRHLPVIMLTVRKTSGAQARGLDTGADDYVIKPFQQEELRARICSLIQRSTVRPGHARKPSRGEDR